MRKLIVPVLGALALAMGAAGGCGSVGLDGDDDLAAPVNAVAAAPVAAADPTLTVTNVVDGDTVNLSDGRQVRLLGIDTPERGACGFEEASDFARTTLLFKEVEVATDPTQDELDRYGRSLLYIGAPEDYSIAVTRAGWAKRYVFDNNPVQKDPQILAAAQAKKAGIWGALCAPPPPPAPTTRQTAAPQDDNNDARPAPAPAPKPAPAPAPKAEPAPVPKAAPAPVPKSNCHPSYQPCIPDGPDLDCPQIGHQVSVVGPDAYRLDADNDGTGCDSY